MSSKGGEEMGARVKLMVPRDREEGWKHVERACRHENVECEVFDLYSANWISDVQGSGAVGCIYRPEFRYSEWRRLFLERMTVIGRDLAVPLYPGLHELQLYESKRNMAYWLAINGFPCPKTWVFGSYDEAQVFLASATYPLVHKTDFGNASQGVRVVRGESEAIGIAKRAFGNGYRAPSYTPGRLDLIRRAKHVVRPLYRGLTGKRLYPRDCEIDVILFQEKVAIAREWRLVKAGRSYFGSRKVEATTGPKAGLHSGSGQSSWDIPPVEAFDLAFEICQAGDFGTMAIDMFETADGRLLVNELQTVFGTQAPNQMYKLESGELLPIRYTRDSLSREWHEEFGEYGQDMCYRLRVRDFLRQLSLASGSPSQ